MASKSGAVRAGKAFVELSVDDSAMQRGLRMAATRFRAWGMSIVKIGASISAVGTAISGTFFAAAKSFATAGAAIDDAAKRSGLAAESLSMLAYAADQSGTSFEAVTKAVALMQKNLVNGGPFEKLGLDVQALRRLSPEKQFLAIADAINAMTDPAERTAAAMAIFGRSGAELLPMFEGGSDGLRKLFSEAGELGLVFSGERASEAAALDDALAKLTRTLGGLWVTIGSATAPALTTIFNEVSRIIAVATKWIDQNKDLVSVLATVGATLAVVGPAVVGLGTALVGLSIAASGAAVAIKAMTVLSAAMVSPTTFVVTRIAALGAAAFYAAGGFDWLGNKLIMLTGPGGIFADVVEALTGGLLVEASQIMWKRLEQLWIDGTLRLKVIIWSLMDSVSSMLDTLGNAIGVDLGGGLGKEGRVKDAMDASMRMLQLQKEILALRKKVQENKNNNDAMLAPNVPQFNPGEIELPGMPALSMSRGPSLSAGGTFSGLSSRMFESRGLDRIIPIWIKVGKDITAINNNLKEVLSYS